MQIHLSFILTMHTWISCLYTRYCEISWTPVMENNHYFPYWWKMAIIREAVLCSTSCLISHAEFSWAINRRNFCKDKVRQNEWQINNKAFWFPRVHMVFSQIKLQFISLNSLKQVFRDVLGWNPIYKLKLNTLEKSSTTLTEIELQVPQQPIINHK